MHLNDVAVRILQEDLVPVRHCPHAVIRIGNFQIVEALLEALDVVSPEAEVPTVQGVDRLLHPEAQVDVFSGQVEFDRTISHEVHVGAVAVSGVGVAADMLLILDPVERENVAVELGEARNVFGAEVHVMEMEFHG